MDQDNRSNAEKTPEENKAAEFRLPPKKTRAKEGILPAGSPRVKVFYFIKTFLFLAASSFLVAFSSYCLIAPNNFATGGVTGIAIIVEKATHGKVPQSVSIFSINAP